MVVRNTLQNVYQAVSVHVKMPARKFVLTHFIHPAMYFRCINVMQTFVKVRYR